MDVRNVHERVLPVPTAEAGRLLDGLAGTDDRLWPADTWPPMRFDRPLAEGARGGHGPVRYTVVAYVPGTRVRFSFDAPRGLDGYHEYAVFAAGEDSAVVRHTLAARTRGRARITWPLFWRPLHDACLEDGLDRAERHCTGVLDRPARHSRYVRALRALAARGSRRTRSAPPAPPGDQA